MGYLVLHFSNGSLSEVFSHERPRASIQHLLWQVYQGSMQEESAQLSLQVLFCKLSEFEQAILRSTHLLERMLTRPVEHEVHGVGPQMLPHLNHSGRHGRVISADPK